MINITNFKDILISKTGGKPVSKVSNFYSIAFQAMLRLKNIVDLPSAMRTIQLTNPIYTQVYNYPLPTDVTIGGIVNLRPITPDITYIDYTNLNGRQMKIEEKFDYLSKRYGIRMIDGIQTLEIKDNTTPPVVIQACESVTANGTILAVGAVTNVQADGLQKVAGSASISFDVGIGSSNGIKDINMASVDLTSQKDILFAAYIPSITNVTGLRLSLGQGALDFFQATVTADFFGNALAAGWNFIRIPKTSFGIGGGAPSWSGIISFELDILGTFSAIVSGFRLDNLVGQIGALFEIDYYSDLQFQTAAGVRIQKPTIDTDNILISGDEIDLFTDHFIEVMAVDLKQKNGALEISLYGGAQLAQKDQNFLIKHPSQRQLMITKTGNNPQASINW